jgi:hypothetical protein
MEKIKMVKKTKKSKNVVTINWEEEEGGKFLSNPGEYVVKAISAESNEDDEGRTYIKWTFEVTKGKGKGATISTNTYITPKALWKLRELLECMGMEIGNSIQDLDLDEAIEEGSEFVIEVEEGNERADGKGYYMQVSDFMALEDYEEASEVTETKEEDEDVEDDEEAEEEEPATKNSKKSKKGDSKEGKSKKAKQVDEDELLDQMEEEIDELGLDIDLDDYDTFAEKKKAFEKAKAAATEGDEEDEDSDEQIYTVEEIESLGTKQLKLIAEEIGLELDEEASTRSKRRSVIAGLRKAGRLDE